MTIKNRSLYFQPVIRQIQRLLSRQDREPLSKTYGCFDRTYWCWKFTDFPGARFQEGVYALAHLFCRDFDGNIYARKDRILTWALSGMHYWRGLQYSDGSFDEAYPFERSLAATAFTCFYVGQAFQLLQDYIPENEQAALLRVFEKAGEWLCLNDEKHGLLSNHLAAAAAALYTVYRITGDERFLDRMHYFLRKIYDHQSVEGWYEEYGGADPGYQTHCTFYLAYIWKETRDEQLLESLERASAFLKYFIHPNGSTGGEYGSRNTEFYFPAGFEMLADALPDAALIAAYMRHFVSIQSTVGLAAMDAYNFLPMLNNYLFAGENTGDAMDMTGALPFKNKGEHSFQDAGVYVNTTSVYHAILGTSKGGVLKVFDQESGELVYTNCGYWGKLENGTTISSQCLDRKGTLEREESDFSVSSVFSVVNQRLQTPFTFAGFRLFMFTLGRIPLISYLIKLLLVHVLIHRQNKVPVELIRCVRFEEDKITINDQIMLKGTCRIQELRREAKFSSIHMGSSRYFHPQELGVKMEDQRDWSKKLRQRGEINLETILNIGGQKTIQVLER